MRNQHKISIEKDKCIKCNLCVNDCPMKVIEMTENGANITREQCLMCGHCQAICPKNIISISGFEDEPIEINEDTKIDADKFLKHTKARRSIRVFKDEDVSSELIEKIIEAGRYSPTGTNKQTISYVVIKDNKKEFEELAIKKFTQVMKVVGLFNKKYANIKMGENYLFKKAPVVIVIKCADVVDGALTASTMEIMAQSLGLGVFYSGMFAFAANRSKKLKQMLGIVGKEKVVTALVIGQPNVKYFRTTQREKAIVSYK